MKNTRLHVPGRKETRATFDLLSDRLTRLENEVDALKFPRRWFHYVPRPLFKLVIFGGSAGVVGAAISVLLRGGR